MTIFMRQVLLHFSFHREHIFSNYPLPTILLSKFNRSNYFASMKFSLLLSLLNVVQIASFPKHNGFSHLTDRTKSARRVSFFTSNYQTSPNDNLLREETKGNSNLPGWLSQHNASPPYWLLSDDLPAWFHGGPPKWLTTKRFNPPRWLLNNEIPSIITESFGEEGPPIWLLKMDKLPEWFNSIKLLPEWLLAFGEVSPPKWVLQDDIPVWLKAGEIPEWLHDGSEVASMHRWLYAVDGKWPEWMSDSKNFPPWINKIADEGEAYVNEDEL